MQPNPENAAPHQAGETYLRSGALRARYGGVSDMWVWRRLNDPASNFPRPVYFGRLRHWRLSELVAWERACAARATRAA